MNQPRTILHADLDAFYASVEQRDNPDLAGLPVAVGGPAPRGVIAAASYEARRFGIKSAMATAKALRLCSKLVLLPPRISHYAEVSRQVFSIFEQASPLVEALSLDEAFLDLTGTESLQGPALQVAQRLKERVRRELQLVVLVGIGPSKFIAKIASDLRKPDGLCEVRPDEVQPFLSPLPVSRLWGVGKVAERQLARLGVRTVGDLAALDSSTLSAHFGKQGLHLWNLAHGLDDRPIVADRPPKSLGQEDTFERDLSDLQELTTMVRQQADRVARRLRHKGYQAATVVLKLKTADFKSLTRQRHLTSPSSDGGELGLVASELLALELPGLGPIRLTGVTATDLLPASSTPCQLSFAALVEGKSPDTGAIKTPHRQATAPRHASLHELSALPTPTVSLLNRTLDAIADRFGEGAIGRGGYPTRRGR